MITLPKFKTTIITAVMFLFVFSMTSPSIYAMKGDEKYVVSGAVNSNQEPDVYPTVDLAKIQRSIIYPAAAKKDGIEGTVIVRVLVSKTGSVVKTIVDRTDNKALTNAAVQAVKKANFTPATKNGKPLQCWVALPIKFQLSTNAQ
jgi:TonB family protein